MGFDVGGGKGIRPTINVTPLVDVVLVLLIIFLVVTPLLTKRFTVQVPPEEKDEPQQPQSDEQLVLYVDEAGAITLNSERVPVERLDEKLRRVFAAREPDVVFFDAASKCAYGTAVKIMDIARGAGAVSVGLITEPLAVAKPRGAAP